MRASLAIAICAFGASAAAAADLPLGGAVGGYGPYSAYGVRAPMLVIYDVEPGVVVRAYWRAPWRNRHYFPTNGAPPAIGRAEDLAAGSAPDPAENYARRWTNTRHIVPEALRARMRAVVDPPPGERFARDPLTLQDPTRDDHVLK